MTKEELCRLEQAELVKLIDEGRLVSARKIGEYLLGMTRTRTTSRQLPMCVSKKRHSRICYKKDGISIIDTDGSCNEIGSRYCCLSVAQAESFILSEAEKGIKGA